MKEREVERRGDESKRREKGIEEQNAKQCSYEKV